MPSGPDRGRTKRAPAGAAAARGPAPWGNSRESPGFAGTVPVALTSWASWAPWAGPKKKPLDTDANRGVYFVCLAKR